MESENKEQGEELFSAMTKLRFNQPAFHYLLIIGIGILIYSNSLYSPFQWDENDFILQNPVVKNLDYFLFPSKARGIDPDFYIFFKTRYIGYLTFALNYWLHGSRVLGYHIFNLTLHLLNAVLVYLFTFLTFSTPFLRESSLRRHSRMIALFSALFFVSHPIQTEAVTYIFQRHASFVTFFYLLSMLFYLQWRLKKEGQESPFLRSILWYGLSLISVVFAMKTKEIAFTLPFMMAVYELYFFTGPMKIRVFRLIPFFLTLAIIPLTHIGFDKSMGEMINKILDPSSLLVKEVSEDAYLFTQFRVILTYIRLLFFPIHQNLDYDYPIFRSFFTLQVFPAFLFHVLLLSLAAYCFFRSRRAIAELRLSSFGVFWFFITLSIESSIIPLQMIICEYRVYLPSVGVFMAVVTSAFITAERLKAGFKQSNKLLMIFLVFILLLLSVLTYARNGVWAEEVRLWEDVTKKSPGSPRGHYNLGLAYGKQGRLEDALKEFEVVLKLNPNHSKARNNLGIIYDQQGRSEDAVRELETVLKLDPDNANAHYNLGVAFGRQEKWDDAIREFRTTLRLKPNDANAHNNLGVLFARQGQWNDAMKEFHAALAIDPNHVNARNNLKKTQMKSR